MPDRSRMAKSKRGEASGRWRRRAARCRSRPRAHAAGSGSYCRRAGPCQAMAGRLELLSSHGRGRQRGRVQTAMRRRPDASCSTRTSAFAASPERGTRSPRCMLRAAARGVTVDRFGITLDWSMGYPASVALRQAARDRHCSGGAGGFPPHHGRGARRGTFWRLHDGPAWRGGEYPGRARRGRYGDRQSRAVFHLSPALLGRRRGDHRGDARRARAGCRAGRGDSRPFELGRRLCRSVRRHECCDRHGPAREVHCRGSRSAPASRIAMVTTSPPPASGWRSTAP